MYEEKYDGPVEKVAKETATQRQVKQLEKASEQVFQLAEEMERRLQSVLQSNPTAEGGATPKEMLPAHPEAIRLNVERITSAAFILQSVLSRLEL